MSVIFLFQLFFYFLSIDDDRMRTYRVVTCRNVCVADTLNGEGRGTRRATMMGTGCIISYRIEHRYAYQGNPEKA